MDAINAHDVERITNLMSDDHVFIDAYGNKQNREIMSQGWSGYFLWFPDYLIEISDVLVSGNTVALLGHASGTYRGKAAPNNANYWRIPAVWKAVIEASPTRRVTYLKSAARAKHSLEICAITTPQQ